MFYTCESLEELAKAVETTSATVYWQLLLQQYFSFSQTLTDTEKNSIFYRTCTSEKKFVQFTLSFISVLQNLNLHVHSLED